MALVLKRGLTADEELLVMTFTGPASYTTGGLDPGFPTMGQPIALLGGSSDMNGKTTGYIVGLDIANKKLKILQSAAAANPFGEVASLANLSTFNFTVALIWAP